MTTDESFATKVTGRLFMIGVGKSGAPQEKRTRHQWEKKGGGHP
jgi:hypothetical protein